MKKTFFLAGLLFSFVLVNAQESKNTANRPSSTTQVSTGKKDNHATPDQKADKYVTKMSEVITLDETQKTKIKSLALDHFKNMENVRKSANGDKEKIKAEGKNSRKIFNEGLKKVLSPTQFETWKSKRKETAKKQKGAPANEPSDIIED
jgi:hypothetical protein